MFRVRSCPQSIGFTLAILIVQCGVAGVAFSQSAETGWGEKCAPYASVPLPAEADKTSTPKESPACASYKSYRGIGRQVNYSAACACAWQERAAQKAGLSQNGKEPTAWVVGGSLILADIYYNGAGVKKNEPLAMRFACEADQQMADAATDDLKKPGGPVYAHRPFEFCDYAITTFEMNFCENYETEIGDDRRRRFYDSLKRSMTKKQAEAFSKLLSAESAYIDTHSWEVDQGGTIRHIRTVGSQEILEELFHTEIVHFERKQWPVLSQKQVARADELLEREYAKAMQRIDAETKDEIDEGGVTAEGLGKAQTAWKAYRDAWVAFARVRYPAKADAIRAEITLRRYQLMKTIP